METERVKKLIDNKNIFTTSNPEIESASKYAFEQCCIFNQLVLTKNNYDFSILKKLF